MESKHHLTSDERAIEANQQGQPAEGDISSPANVGYYEPSQLTDLNKHGRLYLIADGVSGGPSGQMVSQYTIQKILYDFYTKTTLDPKIRLLEVIQLLNREIFERNSQYAEQRPLMTTLTAALLYQNKLVVANVGDNQAYVVWGQDIERLDWATSTSTTASTPKAAANTPALLLPTQTQPAPENNVKKVNPDSHRQRVPQVLGLDKQIKIETFTRRLFPADVVILCSGGLSGYVTEKELARAVSRHSSPEAVPRLLALNVERDNHDAVAITIIRVLSSAVALRPPKALPFPVAPQWSDWKGKSKPSTPKPDTPATTSTPTPTRSLTPTPMPTSAQQNPSSLTQPLITPTDPTQRTPSSITQPLVTPTGQISQTPPYIKSRRKRPWRGCLLGLIVGLLLCALPFIAWRFLIPDDALAAIPYMTRIEALFANGAALLGLELPAEAEDTPTAVAETEDVQAEDTQSESNDPLTPTLTLTPGTTTSLETTATMTATPEASLVVEPNSPLVTPETIFNSPVSPPPLPSPTETPPVSPTPLPTIVVSQGCTNRARFVSDVTILDGTQFAPAESFEKVWELNNAETCPWGPGYTLHFVEGELMAADAIVPLLDTIAPDSNGQIRIQMVAPTTPGQYRGEWQLHDLNDEAFGPVMYLEIEVTPAAIGDLTTANIVHDFIENATQATWSSGEEVYTIVETEVNEQIELPFPQGLVAKGTGLLRGNVQSTDDVLLTYPHRAAGLIEGLYKVDTPLEPTDVLLLELGFPKLSILSDDGVTFEVIFTPAGGSEQLVLSKLVQYRDSPLTESVPLSSITSAQTGTFTLRVLGGDSLSQDWAVWIEAKVVRP